MLAHVFEADIELVLDLVEDVVSDTDAARIGQTFQRWSDVDAVAVDVVVLDDDFAVIDPNPVDDLTFVWNVGIALSHGFLDIDSKVDSVDDTTELHECAVTHELDHPAMMLSELRLDQFFAMDLKLRKRPGFVGGHQPAVADDIGSKDCRKSSILTLRFHRSLSK